ncbi:MAG TPA: FAD-binding oxidoreductase, partial [Pyrinomonadaceae bacterium]
DVGKGLSQVGASANANADAATHMDAHAATRADAVASSTSSHVSSTHLSSTHVTVIPRARVARGRFEPAKALDALAGVVGPQNVSLRGESVVVAPCTTAEVREVLRLTGGTGWPVVPAGGETWTDAGNPLACAGRVVVNTTRLTGVVEHEPADLVATARAGTTLVHFNGALALARQWLPLDPPDDGRATLGGVAATGTGGAQSLAYSPPRSHVLGMTVALADARIIHVGGRVVKNVAGYDLCKLFVGSHGTLGLILDVTFKLRPRPRREATVVAQARDTRTLLEAGRAIIAANLSPVAVELLSAQVVAGAGIETAGGSAGLLLRFAGTDEAVAWQTAKAVETIGARSRLVDVNVLDDDAAVWAGLQSAALSLPARIVLRARVPSAGLPDVLDAVSNVRAGDGSRLCWHAGVGDGRLRLFDDEERTDVEHAAEVERLRVAARRLGGSLVVERAPVAVKAIVDAWGVSDSTGALMRRVKSQLDPDGVFSPGRF